MRLLLASISMLFIATCASIGADQPPLEQRNETITYHDYVLPIPTIGIHFTEACLTSSNDSLIFKGIVFAIHIDTGLFPLPGANVTFRDPREGNRGVSSNQDGYFTLHGGANHPKNDTLFVNFIGYERQKYSVQELLKEISYVRTHNTPCDK